MWGHARLLSTAAFTVMEKHVYTVDKLSIKLISGYIQRRNTADYLNQTDTASSDQMHICSVSWIENELPVSGYCLNPP